jgi:excisionase family DNA binding protein
VNVGRVSAHAAAVPTASDLLRPHRTPAPRSAERARVGPEVAPATPQVAAAQLVSAGGTIAAEAPRLSSGVGDPSQPSPSQTGRSRRPTTARRCSQLGDWAGLPVGWGSTQTRSSCARRAARRRGSGSDSPVRTCCRLRCWKVRVSREGSSSSARSRIGAYLDPHAAPGDPATWHDLLDRTRYRLRAWDRNGCADGTHRDDLTLQTTPMPPYATRQSTTTSSTAANGSSHMTSAAISLEPVDDKPCLNTDEAAALLGVSKWLLLQETHRGHIPHKRIGRRLLYSRQRLLDWLAGDHA